MIKNNLSQDDSKIGQSRSRYIVLTGVLLIFLGIAGLLMHRYNLNNKTGTYTKSFEDNFMKSCLAAGGTDKSCSCSIQYLYDNYSFEEANNLDEYAQSSGETPPELVKAFKSCAAN